MEERKKERGKAREGMGGVREVNREAKEESGWNIVKYPAI